MTSVWPDIRYGLRQIRRGPGFAAVTILTLTLGIGANTAIFSILNALTLRSLPVWRPDRLMQLTATYRNGTEVPFSFATYQLMEQNQRVFSSLFGWTGSFRSNVEVDGKLSLYRVRAVTGNYYSALGAVPFAGRLVGPEDAATPNGAAVAVIGYEFWQQRFGGDPGIVGRSIRVDGEPFTIIGVSRPWFTGMTAGEAPEITVPLTARPFAQNLNNRALLWIFVTGRLKDGITREQAPTQLHSFWQEVLHQTAPTAIAGQRLDSWLQMGLGVEPAATGINRNLRAQLAPTLSVLMGVSALIVLVACVNLASLTLARAAVRSREVGVRMSLGATRLHITRQLMVESLLVSGAGTLLALTLANWTSGLLVRMIDGNTTAPVLLDLHPDWNVFGYAALMALSTGVAIALAPILQAFRHQPLAALQGDERTLASGAGRLGKSLIVAQVALSFVLLLGAGLLLRTFQNLSSIDPNFQRAGMLQVVLQRTPDGDPNLDTSSYRKQLLDSIAALPGVISASFASAEIPIGDTRWRDTVSVVATDDPGPKKLAILVNVTPGFSRTLGIPILSGRDFDWSDDEQHPRVAMVDSNLARQLAPSGDVTGMRVRFGVQPDLQHLQVVGVVGSARLVDLRDPKAALIYVPALQFPPNNENLFVRAQNPAAIERAVERELQSRGQEYPASIKTLEETNEQALTEDRATATLSSLFAGLGLLLAGIGLFGLMSYTVTRRTREIGIRLALGSQPAAIRRLILGESLLLTLGGIIIGVPCALATARLIARMLFGVTTTDPLISTIASATLLAMGIIGGYWPARRAMNTDPMIALRSE